MANEVTICNLALSRIGDNATVVSINPPDGTQSAEACARFYPLALATIMEAHPWSFAIKRAALARLADYDTPEGVYAYSLPSDFQRLIDLRDEDDTKETTAFAHPYTTAVEYPCEIEAQEGVPVLLTQLESPVIRYISSAPKASFFSATFVDALAWKLAGYLVGEVVRGDSGFNYSRTIEQYYQVALMQAKAADVKNYKHSRVHVPIWIRGR